MTERHSYKIVVGNRKERGQLEELGVDGLILLEWIFSEQDGDVNWIDLA